MDLLKGLENRFYAAVIDMVAVSAGCYAAAQADGRLLPGGSARLRTPALIGLGAMLLLEAATGRSLGKWLMQVRVERTDGGAPNLLQTIVRALSRWLAPLIALASLLSHDLTTSGILMGVGMTAIICEVPACYIALMRTQRTIFDLTSGTQVAV